MYVRARLVTGPHCCIGVHHNAVDARVQQDESDVRLYPTSLATGTDIADSTCRPPGNDRYVRHAPANPKDTRWQYDDDVSIYCARFLTGQGEGG